MIDSVAYAEMVAKQWWRRREIRDFFCDPDADEELSKIAAKLPKVDGVIQISGTILRPDAHLMFKEKVDHHFPVGHIPAWWTRTHDEQADRQMAEFITEACHLTRDQVVRLAAKYSPTLHDFEPEFEPEPEPEPELPPKPRAPRRSLLERAQQAQRLLEGRIARRRAKMLRDAKPTPPSTACKMKTDFLDILPKLREAQTGALEIARQLQSAKPGTLEHTVGLKADSFATEIDYLLQRESLPELAKVPQKVQPKLGIIQRSAYRQGKYRTLAGFGRDIWLVTVEGHGWAATCFGVRASRALRAYQAAKAYYQSRYLNRKGEPEMRFEVDAQVTSILRVVT